MKRYPLRVMASLLLIVCLAGCTCQHEWVEASCMAPKTCSKCGETEGELLPHEWVPGDCTTPKTCKNCGETSGDALGHQVSEWTTKTPSTCVEKGIQTGICTRCKQTVEEPLPLAEHTPGEWTVTEAATASSPGTRVKICTVCKKELEKESYSLTPEEIKAQFVSTCQSYSYDEVARNPDTYKGKPAKFKGQVIQSMPEGDSYTLRVNVTPSRYYWDDTILVTYTKQSPEESNILEDDIVTFYGTLMGMYTYESVMGASITVPLLSAKYIDPA